MSEIEMTQLNSTHLESQPIGAIGRNQIQHFSSIRPTQGSNRGLLMTLGIGIVLMSFVILAAVLVSSNSNDDENDKINNINEPLLDEKNDKINNINEPLLDEKNDKINNINEPLLDEKNDKINNINEPLLDEKNDKINNINEPLLDEKKDKINNINEQLLDEKNEKITINDILNGNYTTRLFNGTWISDDEILYFNDFDDLLIYNITSDSSKIIIEGDVFLRRLNGENQFQCTISPDFKFVLIGYDSQKVYRHSFNAKYEIYDTMKRSFQSLIPDNNNPTKSHLQLVEWAPTGSALAYVFGNNIYYKSIIGNLDDKTIQLTKDGSHLIYNGIADWVYEEEMFKSSTAFWFSPSGKHLAYVTFDDTAVDMMPITYYGDPGVFKYQYPLQENLPYPKAGRNNPTAFVTTVILPTDSASESYTSVRYTTYPEVPLEHLIGNVIWATDSELLISTFNRVQNDSRLSICNIDGACKNILTIQEPNGWVDVDTPKISKNGSEFLALTSQKQTKWYFRHILLFNRNGITKHITAGDFSVDTIVDWDEDNGRIYFTAPYYDTTTTKSIPSQSHLYYISDTGSNPNLPICLTCELKNLHGEPCYSNMIDMSKKWTYLIHSCNGPSIPEITIRNVQNSKIIKEWESNQELRDKLQFAPLPITKDFDIPVGNGFIAKARLWLPFNFNESLKYPLFVDVYGGPGYQKNSDGFTIGWSTSLVSSHNIICASIDGRGSGRQSIDLMFQINRRLGTYEIEDQIEGARWLINHNNFIDPNRTAIWGWSYGGYASAMVMGTDTSNVFKCGISVAPGTSWLFYDTIYTERYMGLPTIDDNYNAYNTSDVTNHIQNFHNKKYYIIHGNVDDNVHYQQSMILSRALEKDDILFRSQSYPDENHGLDGVQRHLYHSLEDFLFTECFNKNSEPKFYKSNKKVMIQ